MAKCPAITIDSSNIVNVVASNRQKLTSIFKAIVFCGRQNIALCGHHDNITDIERDLSETKNNGNFWALLNFRVDSCDTVLGEHLAKAGKNATYTSSTVQNQMIDVLADQIRGKIIRKVHVAKWFTLIANEVIDASNKEILSLVLRYVDPNTVHPQLSEQLGTKEICLCLDM